MRPENFVGVGQQNFSQTNNDEARASSTGKDTKPTKDVSQGKVYNKLNLKFGRYAFHAAAILAVLSVAGLGKISSGQAISTKGTGSTKNQTSMVTTGAILASSTQSVIAEDVAQKAQDLTNLSSLAMSGDDFLSNRSSVLAAGAPNRDIISYKVKQGDSLNTISSKFNITTDTIKWANNITNDEGLKPDTELIILPVSGVLYTAQEGDDIPALADKFKSSASLIDTFNGLEGKSPLAGMKLVIPDGVKPSAAVNNSVVSISNNTSTGANATNNNSSFGSYKGGFANTYYWGQCTWYVASKRQIPNNWGNAISWYYNAQRAGYATGSEPKAGAIGWERRNHVVYIESVNSDGTVNVSEMNYIGGPGVLHYRTEPASRFLYIY